MSKALQDQFITEFDDQNVAFHPCSVNPLAGPSGQMALIASGAEKVFYFIHGHTDTKLFQLSARHRRAEGAPSRKYSKTREDGYRRDERNQPHFVRMQQADHEVRMLADRPCASKPSAPAKACTTRRDFLRAPRLYSTTLVRRWN